MTQEEEICRRALFTYGFDAQANMVSEECAELIDAICKYRRNRCLDTDVITEIADVMIMCEQMACYFGKGLVEAEKEKKLQRLKEKLFK